MDCWTWRAVSLTLGLRISWLRSPRKGSALSYRLDENRHEMERESPYRGVSAALRANPRPDPDLRPLLRGNARKPEGPFSTRRYGSNDQRQTGNASRFHKNRNLFRFHDRWKALSVVFRRWDESRDQAGRRDTRGWKSLCDRDRTRVAHHVNTRCLF